MEMLLMAFMMAARAAWIPAWAAPTAAGTPPAEAPNEGIRAIMIMTRLMARIIRLIPTMNFMSSTWRAKPLTPSCRAPMLSAVLLRLSRYWYQRSGNFSAAPPPRQFSRMPSAAFPSSWWELASNSAAAPYAFASS
ncbi:hypothetical protein [Candidatus Protofrankia datiscae]|uniref:hypothetical protein n=1 Tax=Candidatus Protofrankia datiscae TaxID=2716812 RepID=UPI0013EF1C07|nr:hypothetical protein [Candidatus Protofrankia datiscae]